MTKNLKINVLIDAVENYSVKFYEEYSRSNCQCQCLEIKKETVFRWFKVQTMEEE